MNVTIDPLSIEYQQDFGLIDVNTEFTEGLAYRIEKMLKHLYDYYCYRKVIIRLNSPGGSLTALKYILSVINQTRRKGLQIHTEATFMAASAGALMLSHGQVGSRTVNVLTSLLYHHTRVTGATSALTSSAADMLSHALKRNDAKLVFGLVSHIKHGFGGVDALSQEGLARCELLLRNKPTIAQELDLDIAKPAKWLNAVTKVFKDCGLRSSAAPLQKFLEQRFTPDTTMDLQEAYALLLIDRVHLAPSLPACAYVLADQPANQLFQMKLPA